MFFMQAVFQSTSMNGKRLQNKPLESKKLDHYLLISAFFSEKVRRSAKKIIPPGLGVNTPLILGLPTVDALLLFADSYKTERGP